MKKLIFVLFFLRVSASAENIFTAFIKDSLTNEALIGASAIIIGGDIRGSADINGKVDLKNIPDGKQTVVFNCVGYKKKELILIFPLADSLQGKTIFLSPEINEIDEIIVSTTRTNSRIEDVPVKMEVIALDEIEEMTGINPTNVSMLLTEASGVQQQITSPTSGNINARIYGLDGQYTQILKDGFPMFSGYSSGFSIMQIPPLDLKQIEIVKGAASALYGGDAIAGVMNLVSKSPTNQADFSVLLNQTQKLGTDINTYYSRRNEKFGIAMLATQNFQQPIDVNGDGFTDIPKTRLTTFAPKFFYYPNKNTTVSFFINSTSDSREGGDLYAIKNKPDSLHSYIDKNSSDRIYSQFKLEKVYDNRNIFTIKNGVSYYNRLLNTSIYTFGGYQLYSYSEISLFLNLNKHKVVLGGNLNTDQFTENKNLNPHLISRNYNFSTVGVFAQDDWSITKKMILQTGVRSDYQNQFKLFVLPRFSLMYKFTSRITARAGAGLGYKAPTIFSAGYEDNAYYNVRPLSPMVSPERSYGINGDINYKRFWGNGFGINFNQAFFFTRIKSTLIPDPDSLQHGIYFYTNASLPFETQGAETNIRIIYKGLTLHAGYTYTDAEKKFNRGNRAAEFVARDRLLMDGFLAVKSWEFGLEGFYTGKQYIGNDLYGRGYWDFAFMLVYKLKTTTFLINLENFTDQRQTRWESIVVPPYSNPSFKPVYAPLNGMIINLSVRVKI